MRDSLVTGNGTEQKLVLRRRMASAAVVLAAVAGISPLAKADATWTGAVNQDWNNVANWNPNPPGSQNYIIELGCGNFPVISANSALTPVDMFFGRSGSASR